MQLPEAGQIHKQLKGNFPTIPHVEQAMASSYIFVMASGQVGDELKFYFHCQLADGSGYALAEVVFKQGLQAVMGTLKTTKAEASDSVKKTFERGLSGFTA